MAYHQDEWKETGRIAPSALREARMQAHYAVQWLARAARSYVKAEGDDSHMSLLWDHDLKVLLTRPVTNNLCLGLELAGLAFIAVDTNKQARVSFPLHGQSDAQAGAWIESIAYKAGLDPELLDHDLPWEMAHHAIADGDSYNLKRHSTAFVELSNWYQNAAQILEAVSLAYQSQGASPVRCWPHHFDIATLITLEPEGEDARSVGAGMSPGDETFGEPYFYVSPWPYPDAADLPDLPAGGHWHTQGFSAAVATSAEIAKMRATRASPKQLVLDMVDLLVRRFRE